MTWILCPQLRSEISHLEDAGWVSRLQRLMLVYSDSVGEDNVDISDCEKSEEFSFSRQLCLDMEAYKH